jgi:hypothetical protein
MSEVPIDRLPGQPETGVVGFTKKMSISVALGSGAFGSQITPLTLDTSISFVTADQGVTIRNASVTPGAISDGLGHFSMNRSVNLGIASLTFSSNVRWE